MGKKRTRIAQGLIGGAMLALLLALSPIGVRLEHLLLDLHSGLLSAQHVSDEAVLVALDDTTLDVMAEEMDGLHWPYPRAVHAQVIRALLDAGAKAVAVDIIFDLPSGYGRDDDRALAAVMSSKKVYLAGEDSVGVITPVLSLLTDAGANVANAAIPVDRDGTVRWSAKSPRLPQTSVETARYVLGISDSIRAAPALPTFAEVLLEHLYPGSPVSRGLISFPDETVKLPRISYFEVYTPDLFSAKRDKVKDKIVFIGRAPSASLTLQNQSDIFFTHIGFMPGVEIHAHHFLSLLHRQLRLPLPAELVPFMLLIWLAVLTTGFFYFRRLSAIVCFALCGAAFWEAGAIAMFSLGLIIPVLLPASLSIAMSIGTLAVRYVEERDARLIVRAQLHHYLPPRVAEHVLRNPSQLAMAGDRKEITLLFADVAGFTTLSEIETPERILTILQTHLKDMAEAIFSNDGTLDKYLGDGIMAFWGAPEAQENQADLALKTALEMLQRVVSQNKIRAQQGIPELKLRIGLHTGDAIVGNIGSELFFDYTAIGNTVNTAARLEGANKPFATLLLLSDSVRARLSPKMAENVSRVGRIGVQGRKEPIEVFTVLADGEAHVFDELSIALTLFDKGELLQARACLEKILLANPSFMPVRFYLEQLAKKTSLSLDSQGQVYWPLDSK